eukprot:CAMPEP_0196677054 /NCGR_PEP_ID=MMETSP1090-20130531/5386_1 /TAXON_ID=37098 /ORGANISM="Isochrysis sp, Strain CCMP1244" /LENGTH=141 /DNA_ID=CAMNT_0042015115 /DNA_START=92 /DNA_END=514 /DNA_ORIENTATION=-
MAVDECVRVVLLWLVHGQVELRCEVEGGVPAPRANVCARKLLCFGDEGVAKVADSALLAQRPRLLDQVQRQWAEHADGRAARHKGEGHEHNLVAALPASTARAGSVPDNSAATLLEEERVELVVAAAAAAAAAPTGTGGTS